MSEILSTSPSKIRSFLPGVLISLLVFSVIAGLLALFPQTQSLNGIVYPLDGQHFSNSSLTIIANQKLSPSVLLQVITKNGESDWLEALNENKVGVDGYSYSFSADFQDGDRIELSHQLYNAQISDSEEREEEKIPQSMSWVYSEGASTLNSISQTSQSELALPEFEVKTTAEDGESKSLVVFSVALNLEDINSKDDRYSAARTCEYYGIDSEWLDWNQVNLLPGLIKNNGGGSQLIQPEKAWNNSNACYFVSLLEDADSIRYLYSSADLEAKASMNLLELYAPDQDFSSLISIEFETPFYDTQRQRDPKELIAYRAAQKNRLASLISISPSISVDAHQIVLYPERAIISLDLKPNRRYQISINSGKDVYGASFPSQDIQVETGDLKYLGIRQQESQAIFMTTAPPTLEILHAHVENPTVKLCRVSIETYAKVEQLSSQEDKKQSEAFFLSGLDQILGDECKEKEISLAEGAFQTPLDIHEVLGESVQAGMYVLSFAFQGERKIAEQSPVFTPLFFTLVDSHISMKFSKNGKAMFWVNDLSSGDGLAGIKLRAMKNIFKSFESKWDSSTQKTEYTYYNPVDSSIFDKSYPLGTTDSEGFLTVDLTQEDYDDGFSSWYEDPEHRSLLVVAEGSDHLSYVVSKWNSGIARWNFGFAPESWGESAQFSAHIYPDRKLYLPGDTVHIKAIIREEREGLSIPTGKIFQLTVRDSNYETLVEEDISINEYGSFLKDIEIDSEAPLGTYRVDLRGDNGQRVEYIKGTEFNVEEFQKPSFKVEVSVSSDDLEEGLLVDPKVSETKTQWGYRYKTFSKSLNLKVNVVASYYQGGLVKEAPVHYTVFKQYYYESSYWDDCYYGCFYEPYKEYVSEGSGQLDDQGQLTLEIPIDHETSWSDYKYLVEVSVSDESSQKVSGIGSVIAKVPVSLRQYNPYTKLEWDLDRQFVPVGEELTIILKPERKWNASYEDHYRFLLKRRVYSTKHQQDANGDLVPILDFEDEDVSELEIGRSEFELQENGTLTSKLKLPQDGEYRLSMVEGLGNTAEVLKVQKIYAYNPDEITNTPVVADNKIAVLSEKVSYHLGETAKLFVRLPFAKGKALITIERKNVISKEVVDIPGNTLIKEYLVDDSFLPNAYISIIAFKPARDTKLQPEYKVGYTEIIVDKTDKKLFTDVETDKQSYAPQEKVSITISTKDQHGKAVASEVSVAVVDEALIAMLGNIDMDILPKFYRKIVFQTHTALTNVAMLQHIYFARKGIIGGSGAKEGGASITTRSDFKNTAFYVGQLTTGSNGKATTTFTLPDNIGEFRVIVLGHSKNHFFGAAEANIAVRQDIVIEESMPLIVRRGDDMRIGATVFNNSKEEKKIAVSLDAQALSSSEDTRQIITIPAQKKEFVTWRVRVSDLKASEIVYTLSAVDQETRKGDRLEKTVEVAETPLLAQRLHWTKELVNTSSKSFDLLSDLDPDLSTLTLSISQSLLVGLDKIMSSLLVYPYGCIEQTISSTLPNAIVNKLSGLLPLDIKAETIQKNLKAGIKRFQSMQVADGGFAYWEGGRESEPHITPYVLSSLAQMQDLGVSIPQELIDKGRQYIENQISSLEGVIADERLSQLVHEAHALATLNSDQFNTARILLNNREEKLSSHERIVFALALAKNNIETHRTRIQQLIKTINISASQGNPRNYYWDARADKALYAQLLIRVDPTHEDLEGLIKELYSIDWGSYYYSTQAKIQSFIAFSDYLQNVEQPSAQRINMKYQLGEKTGRIILGSGAVQKRNFSLSQLGPISSELSSSVKVLDEIEKPVYIDILISQVPNKPQDIPAQQGKGMSVKRQYFRLGKVKKISKKWWNDHQQDISPVSGAKLKLGESYLVKIHIGTDQVRQQVALESYLPSGLKLVNPRFLTETTALGHERGYNWPFNHQELRSDRFFASAKRIDTRTWSDKNEYEVTYVVRAIIPGTFMEPPVSVYPMYQPEGEAHTAFRELVIEE